MAAEVAIELAFALIELGELTQQGHYYRRAVEEWTDFEERQKGLYSRNVEVLCRWGRLWKDCGDRALSPAEWWRTSAGYYRRAYEVSGDYYPGINLATLEFLIAASVSFDESLCNAEYRTLAEKVKMRLLDDAAKQDRNRKEWKKQRMTGNAQVDPPPEPDDVNWRLASRGEACLLLGEAEAFEAYQKAWNHQYTAQDKYAREAIRKQAERIMKQQGRFKPSEDLRKLHEKLKGLFR